MNETPDLLWLGVVTVGVLALGGMMFYATIRYRAWQDRRHSRPTDWPCPDGADWCAQRVEPRLADDLGWL